MTLAAGVAVAATLTGTQGNDTINGTSSADTIKGFAGNDTLSGRLGNDVVLGGLGSDIMFGDKGGDTMRGNVGGDTLQGGSGNDTLEAGNDAATDYVYCGDGNDTASIKANDLVDGDTSGQSLLDGTNTVVTSCETIIVNGIRVANP